jgi:hypothetical protein
MDDSATRRGGSRREFVAAGAAAGLGIGLPARAQGADAQLICAPLRPFRTSLSVSPFTEAVLAKVALTDGDFTARTVREVQDLFLRHGATEIYARIATRKVAPQGGVADHGWARGLERARLARDMDLPFNPELGLWAEYGDGGNYQQAPDFSDYPQIRLPAPWFSLTIEQMTAAIRQYTALVAKQILATGARVPLWDIGNEVEFGIAGVTVHPLTAGEHYQAPDKVDPALGQMSSAKLIQMSEADRIAWSKAHLWPHTGRLIAAAAEGIRSVAPGAKVSTHISPIGQKTSAVHLAFWETVKEAGFLPDQFGFSYYPGLGRSKGGPQDTFAWFKETATALKTRYGRPVFIAEGGVASGVMPPPFTFNDPIGKYGLNEADQYAFNRDLIAWGAQSGCLAGYRPWAPDLCLGAGWAPMSWFDQSGSIARAKPVMRAFEDALPSLYLRLGKPAGNALPIAARVSSGRLQASVAELVEDGRVIATASLPSLGAGWTRATLHTGGQAPGRGASLVVREGGRTILRRRLGL